MKNLYDYEKTLTKDKKKKQGITYTPKEVVSYINEKCLSLWDGEVPPRVIDFSSGTGVFLVDMAEKIRDRYQITIEEVYEKYIYANDLDSEAIKIFSKETGCENVTTIDGLMVDLSAYDIIVGNPPYVKIQNIEKQQREKIKSLDWCTKGNIDLFIAFSEKKAKSGKIYGMICPNSWIKSSSGSKMRQFLLRNKMDELVDFREKQIFKETTYTTIIISSGEERDSYLFKVSMEESGEQIDFAEVNETNFFLKSSERDFIASIEERKNKFLDHFDMSVGIATLYDKGYYLPNAETKDGFVVFGEHKIELDITKRAYKASKLDLYEGDRKDYFIFPYKNGKAIKESEMIRDYPQAYSYLSSFKNIFLSRDKGEFGKRHANKEVEWYEYGRTQALSIQDEKILIAPLFKKVKHLKIDNGVFFSGYCIMPKKSSKFDFNDLEDIMNSNEFQKWIELNGSHKRGGYFSINKNCFKNFKF